MYKGDAPPWFPLQVTLVATPHPTHTMHSLTHIVVALIALSGAALEGAQARPFDTRAGLERRSRLAYRSQMFEPSLVPRTVYVRTVIFLCE